MADRTVRVRLEATVAGFNTAMQSAQKSARGVHDEIVGKGKSQRDALDQLGKSATIAGAAVLAGLGFAAKASMGFEKELSNLKAASGASATSMEQLRTAAINVGRDTMFSASQAAEAETALAKAGVEVADILGGALTGTASLAAAGQLELADAAEIAAGTMAQFDLKGSDVVHIADLLAAGAGKAQGEVSDMAMALKQSGLVAAQTGLSVEETTGALAAFAENSLLGSDAGTSLKTMLQRLNPQSDEAAKLMSELGLSAYDSQGRFVGLAEYSGRLQDALSGMSEQQRAATMQVLFGSDAVRAAAVLYKNGQQGVQGWIDKVNDAGYAAEYAATANDNLSGDLEQLRGSIETALIQSGSKANDVLREMTQAATGLVNVYSGLPGPIQGAVVGVAALTGGLLLFGGAAAYGVGKVASLKANLIALNVQATTVDRTMRMLGWTMKGAAVAGAIGLVVVGLDQLFDALAKNGPKLGAMTKGLADFGKQGKVTGALLQVVGQDFDDLGEKIKTAQGNQFSLIDGKGILEVRGARNEINALDEALAGLVSGGHGDLAAEMFARMQAEVAINGVSVEDLKRALPGYVDAVDGAAAATSLNADASEDAAGSTNLLTEATQAAIDALQEQADTLRAAFDPVFAMQQAVRQHAEAQKAAAEAIKEHGQQSQEAKDAQWDAVEATAALEGAALKLTGALESGATSTDQARARLRGWVEQGLLTEEQANQIAEAIGGIVEQARTLTNTPAKAQVSAPGAEQTNTAVQTVLGNVRLLDRQTAMPSVLADTAPAITRLNTVGQYLSSLDGRVVDTTVRVTYRSIGGTARVVGSMGGLQEANGGVVEYYAAGGMREQHVAQIAPANTVRMWAEPETGGEAYIPLAGAKRQRSTAILASVADRFGYDLVPGRTQQGQTGPALTDRLLAEQNGLLRQQNRLLAVLPAEQARALDGVASTARSARRTAVS